MEFADVRDYQPGDDIRHLDPHLHARFAKYYTREYDVYRQLPITILIDASRSMNFGEPTKFAFALELASVFGFVGLAGGDQVRLGVGAGDRIHWSPRFHGVARSQPMFDWIGARKVADAGTLGPALRTASRHLAGRGLLMILSDWWAEDIESELGILAATGQEIWGLHIATRNELEPEVLGDGDVRFVDAESGHEVELALDRGTLERYGRSFEAWREQLQSEFTRMNGRYLLVPTDQPIDQIVLDDSRRLGLIG
jgi:hypothetical protein